MDNNMNLDSGQSFPSWVIGILVVIFLIGLVIGCWGFLSGFKLKKKDNINSSTIVWNELFKNKKAIKIGQKFETNKGIFALTFAKVDKKDFFLPVYIFKTNNFEKDASKLILEIVENKFETINGYMRENNKTINEIFFVLLENEPKEENKNHWIHLTNSKNRGFNT